MKNPANRHKAVGFTHEQWQYAFTNGFNDEESLRLYERDHIPASGAIFWGSALANIHLTTAHDAARGRRLAILTDPTFDEPGRTYHFGLGTSSRKTTGPAVPAAEIGPIDVVLLTHDHRAHNLDDTGRALLPTAPVVVTTAAEPSGWAGQPAASSRGTPPGWRHRVVRPSR